jgi:hypothetical protein
MLKIKCEIPTREIIDDTRENMCEEYFNDMRENMCEEKIECEIPTREIITRKIQSVQLTSQSISYEIMIQKNNIMKT